ncbi:UNVERIFIED_CONTAM: hypothetical protein NY603_34550, partial [Bacteroidetes bacterium 56_B9]
MTMKRAIATAVATALLTSSAVAADLAVKAPPISAAPAWSWTGFYVGLNAGGVWSKLDGALALLQN